MSATRGGPLFFFAAESFICEAHRHRTRARRGGGRGHPPTSLRYPEHGTVQDLIWLKPCGLLLAALWAIARGGVIVPPQICLLLAASSITCSISSSFICVLQGVGKIPSV